MSKVNRGLGKAVKAVDFSTDTYNRATDLLQISSEQFNDSMIELGRQIDCLVTRLYYCKKDNREDKQRLNAKIKKLEKENALLKSRSIK